MQPIKSIFSPEITEALGWTIIHSLWQGIILLIGLLFLLSLLKKYSAQVRYFISFTALIIMLGWSCSTFIKAYEYASEKQDMRQELISNPDYFKNLVASSENNKTQPAEESFNLQTVKLRAWFQRNFPLFLTVWLIGIGLFTVRLLGGLAYNRRLRTLQLLPFEEKWMEKLIEFSNSLNISKVIKAYKSPHTFSPLTLGFMKPIILFPVKAFTGLSEKEIEAIIAHELAHIVRNDYLFNIIQSVIEIVFFYHPAIWTISRCIRDEREHSCDDIAIELTGDKVTYAKALTNAQIFTYEQENLTMAFGTKKSSLLERIKRIQKNRTMKTNVTEKIIASFIIISSIFLVSFSVGNQNIYQDATLTDTIETKKDNDKTNNRKRTIIIQTKHERDSIISAVEEKVKDAKEKHNISEEVEQAIEIALSEKDKAISQEMIAEIHLALKDINFDEIMQEAQIEIEAAMEEINLDSINLEIKMELKDAREEIREAMKEIHIELDSMDGCMEAQKLGLKAAESGLEIAAGVLENMNIEEIVKTSLEAANIAIEMAGSEIEKLNVDSIIQAEMADIDFEAIKKEADIDKEELEAEMKALKEELKQLKKELREKKKED
ncbi:M56 family metallopeptidase [Plebeiibacterium marinum]|uniref:M48 family metalloprotease n=1 Tax=Plebeiibacterium marinum TaxID=2992111 RepID=A0AAE3SL50_9BACT|nr:M56 family metallopeptidase [Plebeiobacterium marinum]MCW3806200.1 M48 family metalloprotease [Plebeiobacterium marinum]